RISVAGSRVDQMIDRGGMSRRREARAVADPDDRLAEGGDAARSQLCSAAKSALAGARCEHLLAHRIVDDTEDELLVGDRRDRNAPMAEVADEIRRTVDRIDQPEDFAIVLRNALLLAQHGIARELDRNPRADH